MTPDEPWRYFWDMSYFDLWAIQHKDSKAFDQAIHVNTKAEAEFLTQQLNECERLREALGFYASVKNWRIPTGVRGLSQESYDYSDTLIWRDYGARAIAALNPPAQPSGKTGELETDTWQPLPEPPAHKQEVGHGQ